MVYFPLIFFCQRWQSNFGLGSLAATMLPYSIGLLLSGLAMTIAWVVLDLPLGPGASVLRYVTSDADWALNGDAGFTWARDYSSNRLCQ